MEEEEEEVVDVKTAEVPPGDSFSILTVVGNSVFNFTSAVGGGVLDDDEAVVVVEVVALGDDDASAAVKMLLSFST